MKRIAIGATVLTVLGLAIAGYYWEDSAALVKRYDDKFKLVGLAIGPFLALLGFFWGVVDKLEIRELSKELGAAETTANEAHKAADAAKSEVAGKVARIEALEHDLKTIVDPRRLWKLRKNEPFAEYKGWKYDPIGAKIVTVALFKGGVGKSHLAANLAAYVCTKQNKPVLLIDLDYQGSVSTMVLSAAGLEQTHSNVDALFDEFGDLATLSRARVQLANSGPGIALNRNHGQGHGLPKAWIVPSDYTLNDVESRLLIERVMHEKAGVDERYRLAHLLLQPDVRRDYAMIIIDTPPRMSLGTVNALVASHYYVVPTILDKVSSEAVRPFLEQIDGLDGIKKDLELDNLKLAGIVGTLTREMSLSDTEKVARAEILAGAQEVLGTQADVFIAQNLPRKKQITDGDDLGYFLRDDVGPLKDRFYDAIFDELWMRMHPSGSDSA